VRVSSEHGLRGWLRRRFRRRAATPLTAPVRLGRRADALAPRIRPGDIAVIDQVDLDRPGAEALVERGVAAVLNTSASISGRYPNLGPKVLTDAGVVLLDRAEPGLLRLVDEGEALTLRDSGLFRGEQCVTTGTPLDGAAVAEAMAAAEEGLWAQLEAFALDTVEFLRHEREHRAEAARLPETETPLAGRHVVVVTRGHHHREDLAALRRYIREMRPVLIGADGGADVLLEHGVRPDIVVSDFARVSDEAVTCGAELFVATRPGHRPAGLDRVHDLARDAEPLPTIGSAEDAAVQLADVGGAGLIVMVGGHATLVELLDKGRGTMPATVLTRLRAGARLVDAPAASRLHRSRLSLLHVVALPAAALAAAAAAIHAAPLEEFYTGALPAYWEGLRTWMAGVTP
jgi:uncharacterized membrane-anchored protein